MNVDSLINRSCDLLNELINRSYLTSRITNKSNELLETLRTTENCASCKDKIEKKSKS